MSSTEAPPPGKSTPPAKATRRLPWLAAAVALAIALPPPLLYLEAAHAGLLDRADELAAQVALELRGLALRQPRLFRYAADKVVAQRLAGPGEVDLARVRLLGCDGVALPGQQVAQLGDGGAGPAAFKAVGAGAAPLAWVRVELNAARTWRAAALVALASAALGGLLAALLWFGPFRAIRSESVIRLAEVRAAEARVRQLGRSSLIAVEAERERIARDLHDDLGQQLSAVQLSLAPVGTERSAALVSEALETLRHVVADLRPAGLDDDGVAATLAAACARFELDHGVSVAFRADGDEVGDAVLAAALLRVLREALHNAVRHGGADEVSVRLRVEAGELALEVRDEGRGLDDAAAALALRRGLHGLRQRVGLLDGTLTVDGAPGEGVRVRVALPLPATTPPAPEG